MLPRGRIWDFFRLLTDPDRNELQRMIRVGLLTAWPKLKMIENRFKIEVSLSRVFRRNIYGNSYTEQVYLSVVTQTIRGVSLKDEQTVDKP